MKVHFPAFLEKIRIRLYSFLKKIKIPAKKPKVTAFTVLVHAVAWIVAAIWLIPFLGVFVASIRPFSEVQFGWWNLHPFHLDLYNFVDAWTGQTAGTPISNAMFNSLIVTIPATFIPIIVAALAAYSFARFKSRTKDILFLVLVLLQTIPQQMVIVPIFTLFHDLHLLNNYVGLILLHTAFGLPWQVLFLRNFFATLPIEIEKGRQSGWRIILQNFPKDSSPINASRVGFFSFASICVCLERLLLRTSNHHRSCCKACAPDNTPYCWKIPTELQSSGSRLNFGDDTTNRYLCRASKILCQRLNGRSR